MRRVTVDFQGEKLEGEEVDWKVISGEDWSVYQCEDGTKLKVKTVVGKIIRLNKRNEDGEPIYVIRSQNHLVAHVEPHLLADSER
jgi:hypothetical protein